MTTMDVIHRPTAYYVPVYDTTPDRAITAVDLFETLEKKKPVSSRYSQVTRDRMDIYGGEPTLLYDEKQKLKYIIHEGKYYKVENYQHTPQSPVGQDWIPHKKALFEAPDELLSYLFDSPFSEKTIKGQSIWSLFYKTRKFFFPFK